MKRNVAAAGVPTNGRVATCPIHGMKVADVDGRAAPPLLKEPARDSAAAPGKSPADWRKSR